MKIETPKSIRETFLPDEGCVFVRIDESQIEDRMGKMYCGSKRMIELANLPPWEYDAHTENANAIFEQDIRKLPKAEYKRYRYLGKKCVHASWRSMAGDKMSESVSKDTDGEVFIPAKQCQKLINIYLAKNPEIEEIYFPWCRQQVMQGGICRNSWGRVFDVSGLRIDSDLYRKVYSFYPQSECCSGDTEVLTPCGFIRFDQYDLSLPIACSDTEGNISFTYPNKLIQKRAKKLIHFSGTRTSQLVTPSHRMLYITNKKPKVKTAEDLKDYARPQFYSGGRYSHFKQQTLIEDSIILLAALQADSYWRGKSVTWHFNKARKIVRLEKTLNNLKIKHSRKLQKDGTTTFYTNRKNIPVSVLSYLTANKRFNKNLLNLNLSSRRIFIKELKNWDGSKPKSNISSWWYDSVERENSEWVQIVACLSGFRATLTQINQGRQRSIWRVYIAENNLAIPSKVEEFECDENVYCVEVDSGFFVIRHDGKVSVTGNCADWTNQYGVIPGHFYMMARYGKPLNMQIHDEVVASVPVGEAYDCAKFLKQSMERVREIPARSGRYLWVPAEITVGLTLYGGVEFKRFPETRGEFDKKVKEGLYGQI